MNQSIKYILAIGIGIIPFNILMLWYRLTHEEGFTLHDMLVWPLVLGGGIILLILALNRYLLKQELRAFNPGKGTWYGDIMAGIALAAISFLLVFAERAAIAPLLPPGSPPNREVIDLMTGLAQNPVLLALWLGPVVWIGVAAFEEVQRVFFMNCLWSLSGNRYWQWFTIALVAVIWGLMHLYQGPFGVVSVSIQGLLLGIYFFRFRRIWPLIIAHALYDSIQIVMFVMQAG